MSAGLLYVRSVLLRLDLRPLCDHFDLITEVNFLFTEVNFKLTVSTRLKLSMFRFNPIRPVLLRLRVCPRGHFCLWPISQDRDMLET